jgi:hypothetical protein
MTEPAASPTIKRLCANPLCSGGKVSCRITMIRGVSGPDPIPCTIRKSTRDSKLHAKPHRKAPTVKVARLNANKLRFPKRFPNHPTTPTSRVRLII